jgi:Flp pilus assembly protein TadG
MCRQQLSSRRTGAAIVETVLTISVFLLFLFGVVEYCRYISMRQVADAAVREGARFAVVNTTDANLVTDVQNLVTQRMSGLDTKVKNFVVSVYSADVNGNKIFTYQTDSGGNYVQDKNNNKTYVQTDNSTSPPSNYIQTSGNNKIYVTMNTGATTITDTTGALGAWAASNNITTPTYSPTNAPFGQYIGVQIDCDYNPILPQFLFLGNTIHIQVKSLMYSEGN